MKFFVTIFLICAVFAVGSNAGTPTNPLFPPSPSDSCDDVAAAVLNMNDFALQILRLYLFGRPRDAGLDGDNIDEMLQDLYDKFMNNPDISDDQKEVFLGILELAQVPVQVEDKALDLSSNRVWDCLIRILSR